VFYGKDTAPRRAASFVPKGAKHVSYGLRRAFVPQNAFTAFYNDYMMAKRRKAFRRAALLLSAAAWLRRHLFIAMSIARMIFESFAMR